jgi:hypothetical protein
VWHTTPPELQQRDDEWVDSHSGTTLARSPSEPDTLTVTGSARRSMSRGARTVTALAGSDDPPLRHVRVAHYQPPVALAQLGRASEEIGVNLGLRRGQHPLCALAHQLVHAKLAMSLLRC